MERGISCKADLKCKWHLLLSKKGPSVFHNKYTCFYPLPWTLTICTEISVKNVRTGIFLGIENKNGIKLYHLQIPVNFSLSLDLEPGTCIQTNGTENFGRFGKNGKKVIPRKVLLFFWKISTGMNRPIWILLGIWGFSIQMVSVPCVGEYDVLQVITGIYSAKGSEYCT